MGPLLGHRKTKELGCPGQLPDRKTRNFFLAQSFYNPCPFANPDNSQETSKKILLHTASPRWGAHITEKGLQGSCRIFTSYVPDDVISYNSFVHAYGSQDSIITCYYTAEPLPARGPSSSNRSIKDAGVLLAACIISDLRETARAVAQLCLLEDF